MTVKELFDKAENNTLTWEEFEAASSNAKFVDLTEGHYVSKQKYEDELAQKDQRIEDLTGTISARDTDLDALKQKLKDAGDLDALKQASADLTALQEKYTNETKEYKAQLAKQAYEFAVRDFANGQNFSSNAAKRDFIQSMIAKNLKLEDGKILGADDFVKLYSKDNADAFVKKEEPKEPKPQFATGTQSQNKDKKPTLSELMKMANDNPDAKIDF